MNPCVFFLDENFELFFTVFYGPHSYISQHTLYSVSSSPFFLRGIYIFPLVSSVVFLKIMGNACFLLQKQETIFPLSLQVRETSSPLETSGELRPITNHRHLHNSTRWKKIHWKYLWSFFLVETGSYLQNFIFYHFDHPGTYTILTNEIEPYFRKWKLNLSKK